MLLSNGEIGAPCGVPFLSFRARLVRRLPPLPSSSYHRHFQPRLDESKHSPVAHASCNALHQLGMRYLTEVVGEVCIDHFVAATVQRAVYPPDRVLGASSRPVSVLLRLQVRLEYRPKHQHSRRLRNPIPQARYAQGTELPWLLLRDQHLAHRSRLVGALPQIPRQFPDRTLHPVRLDVRDRHIIHSSRPTVAPDQPPCLQQEVLPPYLVDKGMKAPIRFFLRFRM